MSETTSSCLDSEKTRVVGSQPYVFLVKSVKTRVRGRVRPFFGCAKHFKSDPTVCITVWRVYLSV